MNAPTGSLIAYATSPGTTASDGTGSNGLYTSAILNHIYEEDISILQMFQKVRREVRETSNGAQVPWESTSLEGDFYMLGPDLNLSETAVIGTSGPINPVYESLENENIRPETGRQETGSPETTLGKESDGPGFGLAMAGASAVEKSSSDLSAREYLGENMSGIRVGDTVYFNRYSSSSWFEGVILQRRGTDNYTISYRNNKGQSRKDVIGKDHIIHSRNKWVPELNEDIKVKDNVIFFTNFDKIISFGSIFSKGPALIKVKGIYPSAESYEVPLSAILILRSR